ncbi:MAG: glycosyltransferase family 2 protein [Blastocatellia bacterium]|nr:glycosyltransferase family 2 protein [Blastocatellia bacterium]
MYFQHKVAVVIPVCNEERLVKKALASVPEFVDYIVVVDDGSTDRTVESVKEATSSKLHLIIHDKNRGVGAATISGYKLAIMLGAAIVVVMDGDGQMDAADMPKLLDTVIFKNADYVKGNRFLDSTISRMPSTRYVGNLVFSRLMQLALSIEDSLDAQCGYTAITRRAINSIEIDQLYPRYGFLNELLFTVSAANLKIESVAVKTIYGEEVSGINPFVTVPKILAIILCGYLRRLYRSRLVDEPVANGSKL